MTDHTASSNGEDEKLTELHSSVKALLGLSAKCPERQEEGLSQPRGSGLNFRGNFGQAKNGAGKSKALWAKGVAGAGTGGRAFSLRYGDRHQIRLMGT